ncbi:predicted protein [Histoplasma capsulatum H143]|uniref:Uncharacterized protein n=1 Tax=Ajellomyces capsulatus (strain H143) TaxID=544712 RepID=C6HN39_AJECH|nr:predicted protein [Histoplasma capsulatum H143]
MNWTGGRLQRHSYKNYKSQKAAQKQYFARARLKAQKRLHQGPSSSSARSLLSQRLPKELSHSQEREGIDHYIGNERRVDENISSDRSSNRSLETEESQDFDHLRRKLLKRPDWASLAVVRPLRTSMFPMSSPHATNITRRRHRQQQKMKHRIPFQGEGLDADIAIGQMTNFPGGYLNENSPNDKESLPLGLETDMEKARISNSRNFRRTEANSLTIGLWNTPNHSEKEGAELPVLVAGGKSNWISSADCRIWHPPIPAKLMEIQMNSPGRDNLYDELPDDYWSVVGSEPAAPSQDPSESMLLEIEEMHTMGPFEKESRNNIPDCQRTTYSSSEWCEEHYRGESRRSPMPNIANTSAPSTMSLSNLNNIEVVHPRAHSCPGEGSPNAGNSQNSAHSSTSAITSVSPLLIPEMQGRHCRNPERFLVHSLKHLVPNTYAGHELPAVPDARRTSDSGIFDGQFQSGIGSELSSVVNDSARGQNKVPSLELRDYLSPSYQVEDIEQGNPQELLVCFPTQQTALDVDWAARPEVRVPASRGIDDLNPVIDTDEEGHLLKYFMGWPTSQEQSDHYTLLSPVCMEASDLSTAEKPAYPNSLTEPRNASSETGSQVWGKKATASRDSADLSDVGGSDPSRCEISSQDAVVGTTSDSSSTHQQRF